MEDNTEPTTPATPGITDTPSAAAAYEPPTVREVTRAAAAEHLAAAGAELPPLTLEQRVARLEGTVGDALASLDEIVVQVRNGARLVDHQGALVDGLQEALGILAQQLAPRPAAAAAGTAPAQPPPAVTREPVRTVAARSHAPVPGGPVLPPLQPAPSLTPGTLPPLQPAPSLGGPPAPNVAIRPIPGGQGVDVAIDVSSLPEGTHLIPGGPNGEPLEIRVKRPGVGGLAAPRPSGAFRVQR